MFSKNDSKACCFISCLTDEQLIASRGDRPVALKFVSQTANHLQVPIPHTRSSENGRIENQQEALSEGVKPDTISKNSGDPQNSLNNETGAEGFDSPNQEAALKDRSRFLLIAASICST